MADLEEYERLVENGAAADVKPESTSGRSDRDRRDRKDRKEKRERRSRSREAREPRRREGEADLRPSSSGRRRSRSRDRRHRSREHREPERRDFDRGRGQDRDRRPPQRRRDPTPPEVRLQREREREFKELERATRTVFAYNLNIKADERDIYDFFSKAGEVTDIRLITDRHTKRSKGLAYVEFSKQEEVFIALALTGQVMLGQPVMVKPAEAEKNLAWEAQQAAKAGQAEADALLGGLGLGLDGLGGLAAGAAAAASQPLRLQVTGFKKGLTENEIRQIFEPFGAIDSVLVVRDGAGQLINIAYVVFRNSADGHNALQHWHGKSLLDHVLSVTVAAAAAPEQVAGGLAGAGVDELDDEDFKLNTQTRAALMNRLASSAGMLQPTAALAAAAAAAHPALAAGALAGAGNPFLAVPGALPGVGVGLAASGADLSLQQGLLGPPSPIPTQCLLLKNMFDPAQQTEPDWVADITEDVRDEAAKYGSVLHVFVDKDSQGFVYLKFDGVAAAQAAAKVLHGRFYNGHMIQAAFQFVQTYNQHFGL